MQHNKSSETDAGEFCGASRFCPWRAARLKRWYDFPLSSKRTNPILSKLACLQRQSNWVWERNQYNDGCHADMRGLDTALLVYAVKLPLSMYEHHSMVRW